MLANVEEEEEWLKKRKGVLVDIEAEGEVHQICSFMWSDNCWTMSHSKKHLEQMLKDLTEEVAKVDLKPKPASLWWTSTNASEEKEDMIFGYIKRLLQFPFFEDDFKILKCVMNRQGKTCDCGRKNAVGKTMPFGKTSRYTEVRTSRGE